MSTYRKLQILFYSSFAAVLLGPLAAMVMSTLSDDPREKIYYCIPGIILSFAAAQMGTWAKERLKRERIKKFHTRGL